MIDRNHIDSSRDCDDDDDIDLRVVAARLWSGRWWIFASLILFTAAFIAAAFLMTPIYRASMVMVDARSDSSHMASLSSALGQLGGLASLAGVNFGSGASQTEESLAVLQSREFTEGFIRGQRLMPELFYKRWDPNTGGWRGSEETWPTLAQAFRFFDKQVRTVSQDRITGLITVDIEWRDPVKAARWANALIARLNAEMRSRAIESTNASVGYLEKELSATSTIEIRQAINRLMEAQINQRMLANVTQEYAFRVVDRAMPPDPEDVVRPKKLVLVSMGLLLGLMFGVLVVLVAHAFTAESRK